MSRRQRLFRMLTRCALVKALREAKNTDLDAIGKSIAFSMLVAFFPGVVALISLYGSIADKSDVSLLIQQSARVLPKDMQSLIVDQVYELTGAAPTTLGIGAIFGIVVALWSVSRGLDSMIQAINTAYDVTTERSFFRSYALAFASATLTVLAAVVATFVIVRIPNVFMLREISSGACVFVWLVLLYRYVPNQTSRTWRSSVPGALLAFSVCLIGTWL